MRSSLAIVLLMAALPALAQSDVIEHIVAAVDGEPLLASEVAVIQKLRGLDSHAAVEALVDEMLMFREASRLPQAAPTAAEAEKAIASLRERAGADAESLPAASLERIARREATILKYAGFRFMPQVRVDDEEVRKAWDAESAGRAAGPAYEDREAALRAELTDRKLGERIEAWVKELRGSARVRYNE